MTEPSEVQPAPAARFDLKQLLTTLVLDVAGPIIAYRVLTRLGVSTLLALVAGGIFPAINNLRSLVKTRRLEPLGIIVMSFLVVGTAASLISGSVFFALIKESFMTATFGFICLGSLFAQRPLMFYIIRQFVAQDDPSRFEWWNGLWQYPDFRAALRLVTTVWGIAFLLEALVRVGIALALPPAQVVVISPMMALSVTILLSIWMRRYLLGIRERRIRAQQMSRA
jgi:intracellular septation protein A